MSQLNKDDFRIKEEHDDYRQAVIARDNLTNEFTIADIEEQVKSFEKMQTEVRAKVGVAQATVDNIERNHGELLDKLSNKEKHHVHMWKENLNLVKEHQPLLKQIEESLTHNREVLELLYDKFGFVKSDVIDEKDGGKNNETRPPKDWGPDGDAGAATAA